MKNWKITFKLTSIFARTHISYMSNNIHNHCDINEIDSLVDRVIWSVQSRGYLFIRGRFPSCIITVCYILWTERGAREARNETPARQQGSREANRAGKNSILVSIDTGKRHELHTSKWYLSSSPVDCNL